MNTKHFWLLAEDEPRIIQPHKNGWLMDYTETEFGIWLNTNTVSAKFDSLFPNGFISDDSRIIITIIEMTDEEAERFLVDWPSATMLSEEEANKFETYLRG